MTFSTPSIEKILRDNFPKDEGLIVAEADRKPLTDELNRLFDRDEWQAESHNAWWPKEEQESHLCSFRLKDSERYYGYTQFYFVLDENRRLTVRASNRSASVGHLDEVADLIQDCKRRLERQHALKKRRKKVRGFKSAAMLAQLKKVGREEGFDFVAEFNAARVKLWIRIPGDRNTLHLYFAPRRFQEIVPRLPEIVRTLREAYAAGVSFKVATPSSLPWRAEWIRCRDDAAEK